jgi:hypothetical protein
MDKLTPMTTVTDNAVYADVNTSPVPKRAVRKRFSETYRHSQPTTASTVRLPTTLDKVRK